MAFLLFPMTAFAQHIPIPIPPVEEAAPEPSPPRQNWDRPPQAPPTKNILFLIDSSGSMNGRKVSDAIAFAMQVANAPIDEYNICLVTFGSNVGRWQGTDDVDPNNGQPVGYAGWAAMPSENNLQAARTWISENLDGSSTNVIPAIRHSVRSNSGVNDNILTTLGLGPISLRELTIIIISDGEFSEPMNAVQQEIQQMQQLRERQKLPPVSFGFIGTDIDTDKEITTDDDDNEIENPSVHERLLRLTENFSLGYMRLIYE